MKKIAYGCLGILVLIGIIIGAAFFFTADLPKVADRFFLLIKTNETEKAYQLTSKEFQKSTSYEQFKAFVPAASLDKYESAFWNSRSIKNDTGLLKGTITTTDKKSITMEVNFIKEDGNWKIIHLEGEPLDSNKMESKTQTPNLTMPEDEENIKLVQKTMTAFAEAVAHKDFTVFHQNISQLWKAEITEVEFQELFREFIDKNIDLSMVGTSIPVLNEKPVIDEDSVLRLNGYYLSSDRKILFQFGYIYEHPEWKLASIKVDLKIQ